MITIADRIDILPWDSDFFGFRVGKINHSINSEEELNELMNDFKKKEVKLAYYFSPQPLTFKGNTGFEIKLVDNKVTYLKNTNEGIKNNAQVHLYTVGTVTPELLNLSLQSGEHSRFKKDNRIEKGKFAELYRLWIVNSVNGKFAKAVFVWKEEDKIVGCVTVGEKNDRGAIGIIAVDQKYNGKGIGRALMSTAEKWSSDNGFDSIEVITQRENTGACRFYDSCGYSNEKLEYVYHIWKI
jgi:dTDP-4-amino-4,6-dideoxy-D-galactose acyltransferase